MVCLLVISLVDAHRIPLHLIGDLNSLTLNENGGSDKKSDPLVVCFGEMLIDFVPSVGGVSLAEAPSFKKSPGGAPANVAVCIAKLGGSAAFIGKVRNFWFVFSVIFRC